MEIGTKAAQLPVWEYINGIFVAVAYRHLNVGIGTEAAQFLLWEYINGIFVAVRGEGVPKRKITIHQKKIVSPLVRLFSGLVVIYCCSSGGHC